MKRSTIVILILAVFGFTSCVKNDKTLWEGSLAEIDATTWNANFVGVTYPVITRVPAAGRAVNTADFTIKRTSGTIQVRVNLVGPQMPADQTVGYKVFTSPITSISFPATATGQTPATSAGTLAVSDAVAGTHYSALSGKVTIPANSSFGIITIQVLDPGPNPGQARFLGIQLDDTGTIKPSLNYSQVGLVIDQR